MRTINPADCPLACLRHPQTAQGTSQSMPQASPPVLLGGRQCCNLCSVNACLTLGLHACCSPWAGMCCPQFWRSPSACSSTARLVAPGTPVLGKPSLSFLSFVWPGGCSRMPSWQQLQDSQPGDKRGAVCYLAGACVCRSAASVKGCNEDCLRPRNELSRL